MILLQTLQMIEGGRGCERSGRQDGLRWNLANGAAALHRLKFGIKGSKAFLRGRADQSCEMGNSKLGRRVCCKYLGSVLEHNQKVWLSNAVWLLGEKANSLLGEQECSTESHCSEVFVVGCIRTEFRGKIWCLSGWWDPGVVPVEAVGSLGGTAGGPGT